MRVFAVDIGFQPRNFPTLEWTQIVATLEWTQIVATLEWTQIVATLERTLSSRLNCLAYTMLCRD